MDGFRANRSKKQSLQIEPGLYVARYIKAAVERSSPVVEIQIEEPAPPGVAIISIPGKPLNILSEVGDCAVILAPARGGINIVVYARTPNGSVDATVTLEPLGKSDRAALHPGKAPEAGRPAQRPSRPGEFKAMDINVMGHVAGRGDVWVNGGEWIAGPQDPARIEGLSIDVASQSNAPDLVYGVVRASRRDSAAPGQVEKLVPAGSFAGSKGRATPLTGLKLQLRGQSRQTHWLEGQVLFLGSPPVHQEGRELNFVGPTGREPITGVAVSVKMVKSAAIFRSGEGAISGKAAQRVRVFRSARV